MKIKKEKNLPATWSNVIANKKFGTVITESGGGYTWYKNCRLNRITSWHNSGSTSIPSEIIYLKDIENGKSWTMTAMPMPDNEKGLVTWTKPYAR